MEGTCAEELLWFETEGIGGRFMLLELDLSRLYTFEIDEVDAFTWFLAACMLNFED